MSFLRLQHLCVLARSKDFPWDNVQATIWSSIETNLAIICACLPTLRPLVTFFSEYLLLSARSPATSLARMLAPEVIHEDANLKVVAKSLDGLTTTMAESVMIDEERGGQGKSVGAMDVQVFELNILDVSPSGTERGTAQRDIV